MQTVGTVGAAVGRNHMRRRYRARKEVNPSVHRHTDTLAARLHHFTGQERHLGSLQGEVLEQMLIDRLHLEGPSGIARVRLALMHQYAPDDAVALRPTRQSEETAIGIVAVVGERTTHPVGCLLFNISLHLLGHEALDADAADGHMNHTDAHAVGQLRHQRAAEPVDGRQTRIGATEWSGSFTPLARRAAARGIVHRRHQQEARTGRRNILGLGACGALHVRLAEAEKDVEIGIGAQACERREEQHSCKSKGFKHSVFRFDGTKIVKLVESLELRVESFRIFS